MLDDPTASGDDAPNTAVEGTQARTLRSLCVAVVNHNGWKDTLECLSSLSDSTYRDFTPIVIDNASRDDSVKQIRAAFQEIEIIRSEVNSGYSGGCNMATRRALEGGSSLCLVLNNDLVLDPEALKFLVATAAARGEAAAIGPAIMDYYHRDSVLSLGGRVNLRTGWSEHSGRGDSAKAIGSSPIDVVGYIDGCALMFNLNRLGSVGMMDERLFMYFEDAEWCYRARGLGFSLVVEPRARAWHKVGRSARREDVKINYWFHRNRVAFEKKYASTYEWICFWMGLPWHTLVGPQVKQTRDRPPRQGGIRSFLPATISVVSGFLDGLYDAAFREEKYKLQ